MTIRQNRPILIGLVILGAVSFFSFAAQLRVVAQESLISNEQDAKEAYSAIINQQPISTIEAGSITTAGVAPVSGLSGEVLTFPRIGLYGSLTSAGGPIVDVTTGNLDPEAIQFYAKRHEIWLTPTPVSDTRLDIAPAIRAVNPNVKIIAYTMAATTWCGSSGQINYPVDSYYRNYWLNATGNDPNCLSTSDRLLWLQNGSRADSTGINVNLASRVDLGGGNYQYDYAEDVAQVIYDHVVPLVQPDNRKIFDGIFIDVFCANVDWMETPTVKFDYQRAGYGSDNNDPANQQAFLAGWRAGYGALATKLRVLIGDNEFPIIGNCGQGQSEMYPLVNGWMRENFPFQNGGTWFSNMYRRPGGYLHEQRDFRSPQMSVAIGFAIPNDQPYSSSSLRRHRYTLGSMSLGNGLGVLQTSGADLTPFYNWWFDENAVNRTTGQSTTNLADIGWLGEATSDDYQMIWMDPANDIAGSVTNTSFESNLSGWTLDDFPDESGAFVRDILTAAQGTASAKLTVVTPSVYNWYIKAETTNTLSLTANQSYTVTFWAKASVNRPIVPTLGNATLILPITTEWKRYQVVLTPTVSSTSAFRFDVANVAGDVWFDDVHIQTQVTNVYRRDFQYGIVLVNPHATAKTVTLEKSYRRIQGVRDTATNTGAIESTITLQGLSGGIGDAIFLLNVDVDPPARVTNLVAS